jgi:hypothetical protein
MKTLKTIQPFPNRKFRQKNKKDKEVVSELVNPRFEVKRSANFRTKNDSNSLLVQMYSQENEILFI